MSPASGTPTKSLAKLKELPVFRSTAKYDKRLLHQVTNCICIHVCHEYEAQICVYDCHEYEAPPMTLLTLTHLPLIFS